MSPRPHFRGECITLSAGSPVRFSCYRDCHTFPEQPTSTLGLKCEYDSLTTFSSTPDSSGGPFSCHISVWGCLRLCWACISGRLTLWAFLLLHLIQRQPHLSMSQLPNTGVILDSPLSLLPHIQPISKVP